MPLPFLIAGLAAIGSAVGGAAAAGAAAAGAVAATAGTAAAAVGATAATVGAAATGAMATVGTTVAGAAGAAAATAGATAATVGAAATGAMTTVGTTVAGAASGVVGAVGGAATTAGTTVLGVASGAMGTVGGAVGHAAGTVGLKSVAAVAAGGSNTTGAVALGTIATTGAVGVATGISGAAKLSEANSIKEAAMERYHSAETNFEEAQRLTNFRLEELGREKLKVWKSFSRFVDVYSKIQNPPVMNGDIKTETVTFSANDLNNIKAVALSVKDIAEVGAGSATAGGLIGLAAQGGLFSTLTVASTGTAISSLSGAAATNAALAAFGGGSLAAGGAGMAGGAVVLGGLTFAPILAVGGIMLSFKGSKALESARDVEQEVSRAVRKMNDAESELQKVRQLSDAILEELNGLYGIYTDNVSRLEAIVVRQKNYMYFTHDEKKTLERTILSLKLIKMISMQNILDNEHGGKVLSDDVNKALETSRATVRSSL